PDKAHQWHRQGVIRLLRCGAAKQVRLIKRDLPGLKALVLLSLPQAPANQSVNSAIMTSLTADPEPLLLADLLQAANAARLHEAPRAAPDFICVLYVIKTTIVSDASALWEQLKLLLEQYKKLRKQLGRNVSPVFLSTFKDIQEQ